MATLGKGLRRWLSAGKRPGQLEPWEHAVVEAGHGADLVAELAPQGIRVMNLRPHGMPETFTMKDVHRIRAPGITYEQFQAYLANSTYPRRAMTLADVANLAVFMASDKASGMTGTRSI